MFHKWPKWAIPDSSDYQERRALLWFEKRTQVSLAGQIAEAIHGGRRPASYHLAGDNDDIVDNAPTVCGSEQECSAWIKRLFIRTRNQLELPDVWRAVEALANELMERETIRGVEARKIIQAALASCER